MDRRLSPRAHRVLSSEEVAAVLRRAAELDPGEAGPTEGIELPALVEAAGEVGLSPEAVHQALAELDVGALAPIGSGVIAQQALVDGPLDRVERDVDRMLRRQLLVVARREGNRSLWRARTDMVSSVQRAIDVRGRLQLSGVDELRVHLAAVDEGARTLVRLEVDGGRAPTVSWRIGAPVGAGFAAGIVAAGVLGNPVLLVAVGLPAAAITAAGLSADARAQRHRAQRHGDGLGSILADLDRRR